MRAPETVVSRVSLGLAGLVLVLMLCQVVADVFLRAAAGPGVPATPELVGEYYMVAVSVLPLAVTELNRRHIEATIFTDWLGPRPLAGVQTLGFALGLPVCAALVRATTREALAQTERGAYVQTGLGEFLTWPSFWILPLAFALMALVMALRLWQAAHGCAVPPGAEGR